MWFYEEEKIVCIIKIWRFFDLSHLFVYLFYSFFMNNVHSSSKQTHLKLFGVWIICAVVQEYNQTHWEKKTDYPWLEQCSSLFIIWYLDTDLDIDWLKYSWTCHFV